MAKKMQHKDKEFEDLFYKHGFCRTKLNPESRRRRFHHPITIIIMLVYCALSKGQHQHCIRKSPD